MGLFTEDDPTLAVLREDLALPLALDSDGDLSVVGGIANLEAAMTTRAVTELGALAHRPAYGIQLEEGQNAPSVEEERSLLESRLRAQYGREPRIEELEVSVFEDPSVDGDVVARIRALAKTGEEANTNVVFTRET